MITLTNDTSTLDGALQQLGETIAANLTTKGVTASASDGLTTLAGKILTVPSGGGGGATNMVTGTFTTGSSAGTTGSVSINYTGTGYPIALLIFPSEGMYNTSGTWGSTVAQYDAGLVVIIKADTSTTPTYATSGAVNYGSISYVYKSSTSSATSYGRTGSNNSNVYTSSSTDATTGNSMVRFKGNGKTISYYIGKRTSSERGLARSTQFTYIVLYSS